MSDKTILVIEDDEDQLKALSIRLRINDYKVTFARDAATALTTVRQVKPDMILLDLGLPGGDGFLIMDRLEKQKLNDVPVIVVTGRDPMNNEMRSLSSGAYAFLQKPVDNEVLLATIEQAFMVYARTA